MNKHRNLAHTCGGSWEGHSPFSQVQNKGGMQGCSLQDASGLNTRCLLARTVLVFVSNEI